MKKVIALVLAVVLALGMTTVAFAKTTYNLIDVDTNNFWTDKDGKLDTVLTGNFVPGKTYYIPVTAWKADVPLMDSGDLTTKLSDLNNYKLSYTIDDGKNMIDSIKFVSTKYESNSKKTLAIAIKFKDNFIIESQDINMTIKATSKSKDAAIVTPTGQINSYYDYLDIVVTGSAFYDDNSGNDVDNGYFSVEDIGAVLTFAEDADDVTLMFKKDVEVQGNMKGQKKVVVRLDTSNTAIEDKFPDATVRFFAGDKDTFRRDVTVTIPYDTTVENPYLYVVDAKGALTKLTGGDKSDKAANETAVKFDDNLGAFVFKTKTLGNYVLSDVELKGSASSDNSSTTDAPVEDDKPTEEPNPGTGANDFVGLAVALAVVSVAGIAVAKRK